MKKVLLFLISLFIGIGLFLWIGKFVGWQEIKSSLLFLTGWEGLVILILTILTAGLKIWRLKIVLKSQGYNIPNLDLSWTYLAARSISFIAPILVLADEIFMGYALKERNSVPWAKGVASIIIDRILYITGFLIVVTCGLIFFLLKIGLSLQVLGITLGILLFSSAVIFFFYFKSFKKESLIKFFVRDFSQKAPNQGNKVIEIEKEIFNFFRPKKKAMWKGFGLTGLEIIINFVRCWTLILFLGKSIDGLSVLAITSFFYLAITIPIPAALGSHEAIQTFAFNSLGLKTSIATAFTMTIRVAELIVALVGAFILFRLGMELLKTALFRKIEKFFNQ